MTIVIALLTRDLNDSVNVLPELERHLENACWNVFFLLLLLRAAIEGFYDRPLLLPFVFLTSLDLFTRVS